MRTARSAAASVLLGIGVLAGLIWVWRNGRGVDEASVSQEGRAASSRQVGSERPESAGSGSSTTVAGTPNEVQRKQEPQPPTSVAAPEVYEDWISRSSLLNGTPDVAKLIQVLDQLAATATVERTGGTTGKISFRDDPNTIGNYSLQPSGDLGSESVKVTIRTTAPRGSVFEDSRFSGRELQFEFARGNQSNGFSSQVCLLGREFGPMTSNQWDDIYGSSSDPISVGFRVDADDTETRVGRMTLQIHKQDDGSYLACLVGCDGVDVVISPAKSYSVTFERWRRTLGL